MSAFSEQLIARSGYDSTAFAAAYDAFRPRPPAVVLDVLETHAGGPPQLLVDLGSGTGLSARAWQGRAGRVIGVEGNPAMARQARLVTRAVTVEFVERLASDT
ncbi:MAG: hypothetical protein QOI17_632, partial [Gaiellales bacterium]|nr:hypothetical protein [Gaiellales bacterium]